MAKRKRLIASSVPRHSLTAGALANPHVSASPITSVVAESSASAALDELSHELETAREGGRLVLDIPLNVVVADYLIRDRTRLDDAEMAALKESLADRGQQTPIEVTRLESGRYGLISGWRRLKALAVLHEETGEARFATVKALLRRPSDASDAYLAMVEENEIRAALSFYERARIVARAVDQEVFEDDRAGLRGLFGHASRARRSKIGSFLNLYRAIDGVLPFPEALSERAGLGLAAELGDDPGKLRSRLLVELAKRKEVASGVLHLEDQQEIIARVIAQGSKPAAPRRPQKSQRSQRDREADETRQGPKEVAPGLTLTLGRGGSVTLSGAAVDAAFVARLTTWLSGADGGD